MRDGRLPKDLKEGMRDGIPIAMGYFAVAFSLGIYAGTAGLSAAQGFIASMLTYASAGQYAGFTVISEAGSIAAMIVACLVINARYMLMGFALGQRMRPGTPAWKRVLTGTAITDEIFGIAIAREGYISTRYMYGALMVSVPCWSLGTALGIIAGNVLPALVVKGLSVALYGMFLAIVIPASKKERSVAYAALAACAASWICAVAPGISTLSPGNRVIILTVVVSAAAALIMPVKAGKGGADE